jgi:hypothetical protein
VDRLTAAFAAASLVRSTVTFMGSASHEKWTLVGGLMTQLHAIRHGIDAIRPTNDVDIVLHVETTRGVAGETASALESLGYELTPSIG